MVAMPALTVHPIRLIQVGSRIVNFGTLAFATMEQSQDAGILELHFQGGTKLELRGSDAAAVWKTLKADSGHAG
jgi:hypothetical protein